MAKTALKHKAEISSAFDRESIEIRWIPVRKLTVKWQSAQRQQRIIAHAKKIAGAFDPDKFGVLTVTQADDNTGLHHIIDGVHRSTAIDILWGPDEKVPCQVLPTKDPVRAAEIFLGLQTRRAVTAMDNFRVSVQAGNPDSININKVIRGLGYRISAGKTDGVISAVGALKQIYHRYGPEVLKDALSIIQATWGMKAASVNGTIIIGYGLIVGNNFNRLNYSRLKDVMLKKFANPEMLLQLVKGVKELKGGSASELLYQTLIEHYNRGLKAGHLKE